MEEVKRNEEQQVKKSKAKKLIAFTLLLVIVSVLGDWLRSGLLLNQYFETVLLIKINEYGVAIIATSITVGTYVLGMLGYKTAQEFIKNFAPVVFKHLGITPDEAKTMTKQSYDNLIKANKHSLIDIKMKLYDIEAKYNVKILDDELANKYEKLYFDLINELKEDYNEMYLPALKERNV